MLFQNGPFPKVNLKRGSDVAKLSLDKKDDDKVVIDLTVCISISFFPLTIKAMSQALIFQIGITDWTGRAIIN